MRISSPGRLHWSQVMNSRWSFLVGYTYRDLCYLPCGRFMIQNHVLGDNFRRRFKNTMASSPPTKRTAMNETPAGATSASSEESRIIETELHKEAEQSYLSYAMSVIVGRALPDARDGLKPVHRRILYAMHELGLQPSKPYRKSARVVGEVLGKFHPHGDTAVYDSLVRMAQDFSMRIPLISGHGNFGSVDDDPPAAMRYTECRLEAVAADALLSDLESKTVDFLPNFDASTEEPVVLPAKVPLMLVNGSSGIAVGIATKIPPHNLREVVNGMAALINNPNISVKELMKYIPAPDFPTGGILVTGDGLTDAYEKGRGGFLIRAKLHVEEGNKKKSTIVVTELPYQTNKADLVAQIASLVDEGKLTGISDIRDESDRSGMRIAIELKRGTNTDITINQLLKHTALESRFSCNMIALVEGLPRTLSLKDFLTSFVEFRCEVVRRRAEHQLNKACRRLHLVEGYLLAMNSLDLVVRTIREATDSQSALKNLQSRISLSKEQAEGVLGMTLRRLTGLELESLRSEDVALRRQIQDIKDLLDSEQRILEIVQAEAEAIADKFGTQRRTEIAATPEVHLQEVDLIPNTPSIIVYSRKGFIKRMKLEQFSVQGVRGTGKAGARFKGGDSLEDIVYANDHDRVLFFTKEGKAFAINAYQLPEGSRTSIGTAITQILKVPKPSSIAAILPVGQTADNVDVVLSSKGGLIKRTPLELFSKISSNGVTAMGLRDGDSLQFVGLCSSTDTILMTSNLGLTLHFRAESISRSSRIAMGNKSMNVADGSLVGMRILPAGLVASDSCSEGDDSCDDSLTADGPCLFLLTSKGYAKRVPIENFKLSKGRTGKGRKSITLQGDDSLAAALVVGAGINGNDDEEIVISTVGGMLLRVAVSQIPVYSPYARGSRIVKLKDGDEVSGVTLVQECSD